MNSCVILDLIQCLKKYAEAHRAVCEHYGLETTNTIHIAVGGPEYVKFSRDGGYNRINIRDALKRYKNRGEFYDM